MSKCDSISLINQRGGPKGREVVKVLYTPSKTSGPSPEGRESFSVAEFQRRFVPWHPDWNKRVRKSEIIIRSSELSFATGILERTPPASLGSTTNGEAIVLFETPAEFLLVRADFFSRLLFTEQKYLDEQIVPAAGKPLTMAEALRDLTPDNQLWKTLGLPGMPLAIGVNASIRTLSGSELLVFKNPDAQGQMGDTVGPPLSAGAKPSIDDLPEHATLASVVKNAINVAANRELKGVPIPQFTHRAAWRDSGRGCKPEVNFTSLVEDSAIESYQNAIASANQGCVLVRDHLTSGARLTEEAEGELGRWGLNFQAWCLWN